MPWKAWPAWRASGERPRWRQGCGWQSDAGRFTRRLASARSQLGETEWEAVLAEGWAMSPEEAAEYVFFRDKADPPTSPAPQESSTGEPALSLSGREREVSVLVAQGFTNRQISTELGISGRTAGNHVGKILGKLGLRSRAQIASWATEHGLLTSDPE